MKRKAFTMIDMLFTMAIVGTLSAIALPMFGDYATMQSKQKVQEDMQSAMIVTNKIKMSEEDIPDFTFTATDSIKIKEYEIEIEGHDITYNYPLGKSGDRMIVVPVYSPVQDDYSEFGIIINTYGRFTGKPSCIVYNSETDGVTYRWSDNCLPNSLGWVTE